MRRRGFVHQGVEIGHDVVQPIDEGARALRAAVAAMVERVHGKASRRQLLADPPVATAVLGRAMRQHDEGTRIAGGQPRLGVELEAALAGEAALVMLDRAHAGREAIATSPATTFTSWPRTSTCSAAQTARCTAAGRPTSRGGSASTRRAPPAATRARAAR